MKQEQYSKYLFLISIIVIGVLSFIVIKPFIGSITFGLLLGYIFYPLFRKFNNKIKNKNLSALFLSIFIMLLLIIPFICLLNSLAKEASVFYVVVKQKADLLTEKTGFLYNLFGEIITKPEVSFYVQNFTQKITLMITEGISKFIFSIPRRIIDVFIIFFILFYVFKDGDKLSEKIKKLLPLKKEKQKEYLIKRFKGMVHAVIYGYLVIAVVEGLLGGLIFFILGVANPVL